MCIEIWRLLNFFLFFMLSFSFILALVTVKMLLFLGSFFFSFFLNISYWSMILV